MNIVISYDGTDITDDVLTHEAIFSSQVNGSPGTCSFKVKDPNRDKVFVTGKEISLDIDGSRAWFGFITSIKRAYAFSVDDTTDDTRLLAIEGVDINVLFRRRFLYKKSHPATIEGPTYPVATADTTAIADLVANWLDLSSDGLDTSSLVTNVGNINIDQVAQPFAGGMSWEEAMRTVARITGAVFYLNPSKKLVYVDVDTVSAPFAISDTPSGGEVGYRSMSILNDATAMVNDVLAIGAGGGSPTPVADRLEDATSIAAHGRWQEGTLRSGIFKQATINKVADSIINGSPLSHRGHKDDHISIQATIHEPGLLPANKVSLTSDVFSYSDVLPVRRMDITFPTPTDPLYRLTLSHELDDPFDPFDLVKLKLPGLPGGGGLPNLDQPPWPRLGSICTTVIDDFSNRTIALHTTPGTSDAVVEGAWGQASSGRTWRETSGGFDDAPFGVSDGLGHWQGNFLDGGGFAEWGLSLVDWDVDKYWYPAEIAGEGSLFVRVRFNTVGVHFLSHLDNTILQLYHYNGTVNESWQVDITATHANPGVQGDLFPGNITMGFDVFYKSDWVENAWYTIEVNQSGSTVRARVWADELEAVPAFMVSGTVSTPFPWGHDVNEGGELRWRAPSGSLSETGVWTCDTDKIWFDACAGCGSVFDSFSRTVAPIDWGTSDVGLAWEAFASFGSGPGSASVDGSTGILSAGTDGSLNSQINARMFPGWAGDIDVVFDLELQDIPGGSNAADRFDFIWEPDGGSGVILFLTQGIIEITSGRTNFDSTASAAFPSGFSGSMRMRAQADASGIRCKLWHRSGPEPSSWTVYDTWDAFTPTETFLSFRLRQSPGQATPTIALIDNIEVAIAGVAVATQCPDELAGSGFVCEDLTINAYDYTTTGYFVPGTLEVYVNGILQRPVGPVVDYEVHTLTHSFTMGFIPTGTLRVCYERVTPTGGYPINPITR